MSSSIVILIFMLMLQRGINQMEFSTFQWLSMMEVLEDSMNTIGSKMNSQLQE